jgi:hypothetical protein
MKATGFEHLRRLQLGDSVIYMGAMSKAAFAAEREDIDESEEWRYMDSEFELD